MNGMRMMMNGGKKRAVFWALMLAVCLAWAFPFPAGGEGGGLLADITEDQFPDAAFRAYLFSLDENGDGYVSEEEGITLDLPAGVRSIQGIEKLSWLSALYWDGCGLTDLTLPGLPALEFLFIRSDTLTRLNVSRLPSLLQLDASNCPRLTDLTLGHHSALEDLSFYDTPVSRVDLSGCPALVSLGASNTGLTALDVKPCPGLKWLFAAGTRLSSLDVSGNPQLDTLWVNETPLKTLDLTHNPALTSIDAGGCQALTALDISQNERLVDISVSGCESLTALDVSNKPALEGLECAGTAVTLLDIGGSPALTWLYADDSPVGYLDLSEKPNLRFLQAANCGLNDLNVNGCPQLETLYAEGNRLEELDVSGLSRLRSLNVDENSIETLVLGSQPMLTFLSANGNQISSLNLSGLPALEGLYVQSNLLSSLDVTANPALKGLSCGANLITQLDVSRNPALEMLWTPHLFELESLDVTHNPKLRELLCYRTRLSALDLSRNPALTTLWVYGNQLSHLDLTPCPLLTDFRAQDNTHQVRAENGKIGLSALKGFDVSRASDWQGGAVSGNILTLRGRQASFLYNCGRGFYERFTLSVGGTTEDGFSYLLLDDGTASLTGCVKTGDIVIPETVDGYPVTNLADDLFRERRGVTSVTLPSMAVSLGSEPGSLLSYAFSECYDLKEIRVQAGNTAFASVDGVLYSKDLSTLFCYPCGREGAEYRVSPKTTFIDCLAFAGIRNLRDVYLENQDTSWAQFTFADANRLTVHYRPGGRAEARAAQAIGEGAYSADGVGWPAFVSFGDDAPGDSRSAEKAREAVAAVTSSSMTDREKAQALHDWLITHARYSLKYDDETGILVYGEGDCLAYARAYRLLLTTAGVENSLVEGYEKATRIGHAWNRVKLENIWYHVDCAWDDPVNADGSGQGAVSGLERQDYCFLSPQRTAQDHGWTPSAEDRFGWTPENGGMAFYDAEGRRVKGWLRIDGGTFRLDENGLAVMGFQMIGESACVFRPRFLYREGDADYYAGAYADLALPTPDLILPAALAEIEAEIFEGRRNAVIYIPDTVTAIEAGAFEPTVTILCAADSYAAARCRELGLRVVTY